MEAAGRGRYPDIGKNNKNKMCLFFDIVEDHLEMYFKEVNGKQSCAKYLHAKLLPTQLFIIAKI